MLAPFFHDDFVGGRLMYRPTFQRDSDATKQLQPMMELDFVENDTAYSIHADLPGVDKADIDIKVEDSAITITAEKKNKHEERTTTSHHIERGYGAVKRGIKLPKNVDPSAVHAAFENGVLKVTLPKRPEEPRPEGIKVPIA